MKEKLIILGSGPAALTAAIYAARAQLNPLIIEGPKPGGQLMGTTYVENWPGNERILGPQLIQNMRDHAKAIGTRFLQDEVIKIDITAPFTLTTNKHHLNADALIIATGATPKRLHCQGEDLYWGKGVTTCAVCDGAFYKDKKVIIIGGGDSAMENASFMTNFTKDITIIHILDTLTASKAMQERIIRNPSIKILYSSTVSEISGDGEHVTTVRVKNNITHTEEELSTNAVFVAIGLIPNTSIFKGLLELTPYGYVKQISHTETSVPGIFAAGDVIDSRYRQAITSAGSGCMAALDAERYLNEKRAL